ncbi:hypothetical protein G7021_21210 [Pseudomonas carnis]|uniref:hypothetical protein n=1 Tax=Pseudomonas TaxID=286 RepID=UPI001129ED29|nr:MULTISPECIES: hypothetical protein [Pseudomonas]KAA6196220.1 hypothetical protein F3K52_05945 [Pseudomonas lactis]MBA1255170.1 hypothetical protein [Pseudomonas carnis]MBA1268616.1 hypothetical protein [Pseudomonas carnis]MBA1300257.1 hypothetical protein [Pseudomonas carnis]MCP9731198.1 hypothetical protein [Pseudomonas sp. GBPI_506]|tara:strand:- start:22 stop:885 length:864 start_codon:yes stop_codon:yes gene_type:complete
MSHEFLPAVKKHLRTAVGFYCSAPHCGKQTNVFNRERLLEQYDGDAAHIYGANSGSARYADLPSGWERDGAENGIWLCATCHRQVDQNAGLFPGDLLERWKKWAEEAHELGYRRMNRNTHASADIREDLERAKQFVSGIWPAVEGFRNCYSSVASESRWDTYRSISPLATRIIRTLAGGGNWGWNNSHQHWTFVEDFQLWQTELVRLASILSSYPAFKISNRDSEVDWRHVRIPHETKPFSSTLVFHDETAAAIYLFIQQVYRFDDFLNEYRGTSHHSFSMLQKDRY